MAFPSSSINTSPLKRASIESQSTYFSLCISMSTVCRCEISVGFWASSPTVKDARCAAQQRNKNKCHLGTYESPTSNHPAADLIAQNNKRTREIKYIRIEIGRVRMPPSSGKRNRCEFSLPFLSLLSASIFIRCSVMACAWCDMFECNLSQWFRLGARNENYLHIGTSCHIVINQEILQS